MWSSLGLPHYAYVPIVKRPYCEPTSYEIYEFCDDAGHWQYLSFYIFEYVKAVYILTIYDEQILFEIYIM